MHTAIYFIQYSIPSRHRVLFWQIATFLGYQQLSQSLKVLINIMILLPRAPLKPLSLMHTSFMRKNERLRLSYQRISCKYKPAWPFVRTLNEGRPFHCSSHQITVSLFWTGVSKMHTRIKYKHLEYNDPSSESFYCQPTSVGSSRFADGMRKRRGKSW